MLDLSAVGFEAHNEYTAMHGFAATDYHFIEAGRCVEPFKDTTLKLHDVPATIKSTGKRIEWAARLRGGVSEEGNTLSHTSMDFETPEAVMVFQRVGTYDVTITFVGIDEDQRNDLSLTVTARYVRRELRRLTDEDRARYLDAALVLAQTSDSQGKASYGSSWKGMDYFVRTHLTSAVANKHNDRLHDGMGFLTQHIAITSEYEQALQLVDPTVALPFWDYTLDWAFLNGSKKDDTALWSQDIWGDDWFGNATGNALHTVTKGRFAYIKVPVNDDLASTTMSRNAYGVLRAPWNLNESPFITRYHQQCGFTIANQWPSCSDHHYAVFGISDLGVFVPFMAYVAHAGVHLMIGGSGKCDHWKDLSDLIGSQNVYGMAGESTFVLRNVWRYGLCDAPESCSFDSPGDDCRLECRGCKDYNFTGWELEALNSWWSRSMMKDITPFQKEQITRQVFCDHKWVLGEHIEASSPVDVSFWPMHPTLERLLQYKLLVSPFSNSSWYAEIESDWNGICKWGETFGSDCEGHHEHDLTSFYMSLLKPDTDADVATAESSDSSTGVPGPQVEAKQLTNRELMALQDPDSTMLLPYVYENFAWDHCNDLGIHFPAPAARPSI